MTYNYVMSRVDTTRRLWLNEVVTIAAAIRELRGAFGETQSAFAERLGLSAQTDRCLRIERREPELDLCYAWPRGTNTGRKDLATNFVRRFPRRKAMPDGVGPSGSILRSC